MSATPSTVRTIPFEIPAGVSIAASDVIVATATNANGNTSELSFQTATLAITAHTPSPSASVSPVQARVRMGSALFAVNGSVHIADSLSGNSCTAVLAPIVTPLTAEGSCSLVVGNSPNAGVANLTATYSPFSGAFASATGDAMSTTVAHTLLAADDRIFADDFE